MRTRAVDQAAAAGVALVLALTQLAVPLAHAGVEQVVGADEAALADAGRLVATGRLVDAEATYARLLAEARATASARLEGQALAGLAMVAESRGEPTRAAELFGQAEARFGATGDGQLLGTFLSRLAGAAYDKGRSAEAGAAWQRALAAYESASADVEVARTLYRLTFADRDDGALVVARLDRALALARRHGARDVEGLVLHRLGDHEFLSGDWQRAIEHVEQAVPLLEGAGRPDAAARALTSLGRLYRVHGQGDRALETQQRALAVLQTTSDRAGIAQAWNAVAVASLSTGRFTEALKAATAAVALSSDPQRASAVHTRAEALRHLGRLREALAAADAGLNLGPNPSVAVRLHVTRARALASLDRGAALQAAEAAAAIAGQQTAIDMPVENVLTTLSLSHAAMRELPAALAASARAVDVVERRRPGVASADTLRGGFEDTVHWVYGTHVVNLMATGQSAAALEVAERGRARAFGDLLASRRLTPDAAGAGAGPGAGARAATSDAGAPSPPGGRVPQVVVASQPAQLAEIRAQAARLRSTIVSYWVRREATFVWAVTERGQVVSARVPVDGRHLSGLVARTRSDNRIGAGRSPFRELYDLLVAPIAQALPAGEVRRLTIVPHDLLTRLSFAALVSPAGRYLVEDFSLHYAPSVGVLVASMADRPAAADAPYLVVADPALSASAKADGTLGALPDAMAEGRSVVAIAGASSETLISGAAATEPRIRASVSGRRVLHFATHAVVSDDTPLDSYLALAGDPSGFPADDGRLTAEEIYGLQLDADLVVLTACRTTGDRITGDGIGGLARAFVYAGTPALVASLSDLPDATSRFLIPRFYAAWQQHGDKAEALRSAQVALIRALRRGQVRVTNRAGTFAVPEHPAYWANLVLIGEP